jgi:hypothetical protein
LHEPPISSAVEAALEPAPANLLAIRDDILQGAEFYTARPAM